MEKIREKIMRGPGERKPLSSEQEKAVISESRHIRILAGAGAGKTETLTRRILYLLLCNNVDPEKIVAFTFTEKAAQSMKSRIYNRVIEIAGEEYASKLGKMYVGTIHGYALRILQDYYGFGNYDVLDDNQEMAFIMRRGFEIGINALDRGNYGKKCKKFIESVNVVYDELIPLDDLRQKNPIFYDTFQKYEERLEEHKRITFSRLIYLAVNNLKDNIDKMPKIDHLIVDEYQDINHAQEEMIKLLGQNASIMVVGDPRQTIYQWRGSDDLCFERFVSEFYPDAECITIRENRRSGRNIVTVSNSVAEKFENRKFEDMEPTRKENGHVYVAISETPDDEARWIANQIKKIVEYNKLNYSDFGILLRSVNTSGEPIIQEFKQSGIPYIVGGASGLFRREEAIAVGKLFVWLCDDGFWRDYQGKVEHLHLVESALDDWEKITGVISLLDREKIVKELNRWKENVLDGRFNSFQDVYHELLDILRFNELDPDNKLHTAIMANLGRFSNLLSDYENAIRIGGNKLTWSNSNLNGLMWYFYLYATTAYDEQLGEDVRGIDAVQITTIHQAKGLEWNVVFIPAMVRGRFPSSHIGEQKDWLISRDLFPASRYDLKEEDERRLFYVAITRAKNTLVLSAFNRITRMTHMSKFLYDVLIDNQKESIISSVDTNSNKVIEIEELTSGEVESEISSFDAGEIVDYIKCPHFYRMRYVWNYDAPMAEELGYGKALHYCLRRTVELYREGYNPYSAILTAVKEDFHMPYAPREKFEKMKDGAQRMLINYVSGHLQDITSVAEVEYRLEFPRKNSTITGKVDVIIDRDGGTEVREYKTSAKVTKPEQANLQVRLYSLGLKNLGFDVIKGSVVYLDDGKIDQVNVDPTSLDKAKDDAEQILSNLQYHIYDAKQGEFCDVCDYQHICKWETNEKEEKVVSK